jgi:hypothetical protein
MNTEVTPPRAAPMRLAVDADAAAAAIREQSERAIRAHAHGLVAGRRDALRTMTAEQRRLELLALAEKVADDETHADALAAASLPYLSDVENASAGFDVLVQAVRERGRFTADPDEWMARHGLPLGDRRRGCGWTTRRSPTLTRRWTR